MILILADSFRTSVERLDTIAERFSVEVDSADAKVDELLAKLNTVRVHTRCLRKQVAYATSNADKIMHIEMEQMDAEELSAESAGPGATSGDQAAVASPVLSSLALDFNVEDLLRMPQGFPYSPVS
ncbi:hypothetical protein GP486_006494 [Trichoglossum hirsutum]|uniref:Uncharacterized protein n=1 Tax=Trichoglossum hirsutum TaxID=265104 RepID=A0A9P8I806_9PEZI|nr:hypothetical protein GP486_006494 [Trichoglossum hirsutum]